MWQEAVTAVRRFGLGPRPGDLKAVAVDPRGWVQAQLNTSAGTQPDLPSARAVIRRLVNIYGRQAELGVFETARLAREYVAEVFEAEKRSRLDSALTTPAPMIERLVWFWSNHFTVSVEKSLEVKATAGAFEREAIRPYVLGSFRDMLQAVARHPAMLNYLDNVVSVGPNSPYGLRCRRGLNENYGREVLELHTLGVEGGYSQQDVIEVAKALTGWRFVNARAETSGSFVFARAWHEPGMVTVLGTTYDQEGEAQGTAVLDALAAHPATARFIAWKVARHFVSDPPPADLVSTLEQAFIESGGDLAILTRTLCSNTAAWDPPPSKVVPPWDFLVAALRGLEISPELVDCEGMLQLVGQPTWMAEGPAGWPEGYGDWASPAGLLGRLVIAEMLAEAAGDIDISERVRELFGHHVCPATMDRLDAADSRAQAVALLLVAPEFQRR